MCIFCLLLWFLAWIVESFVILKCNSWKIPEIMLFVVVVVNLRLDVYIHDYLVKRDLKATAQAFQTEGKVSSDPVGMTSSYRFTVLLKLERLCFCLVHLYFWWGFENLSMIFAAIDAPGGFLFEWWSVFWDIFIARTNEKHSEVAASYIEVGLRSSMRVCLRLVSCLSHFFAVL